MIETSHWNDKQLLFEAAYRTARQVICLTDDGISLDTFSVQYIRRLKQKGIKIIPIDELTHTYHVSLSDHTWWLQIILPENPQHEAKDYLRKVMHKAGTITTGYILQITKPPLWGRVEISHKWVLQKG